MKYLDGIPAEVAELIRPYVDPEPGTLASIGVALVTKRDAAMLARSSSGIETIWSECEDAYIGIDDANRSEFEGGKWAKPMTMTGPVQAGSTVKGKTDNKSSVFLRLTARYVEAGAAKLSKILLPPDDKAFSIKETPLPELIKAKKDNSQVASDDGQPLTRPLQPGEAPPPQMAPTTGAAATAVSTAPVPQPAPAAGPGGAVQPGPVGAPAPTATGPAPVQRVPLTVGDLAKENLTIARDKAKLAETRIWDWLVESKYRAQMRKVIFDAARLGSGVLKGPHPKVADAVMTDASKTDGDEVTVKIKREIKPGVSYVDLWNIFPDPTCGENIHNGEYIFERDYMSDTQVLALKKLPGYIPAQIDKVLSEEVAPTTSSSSAARNTRYGDNDERKGRRVVWYFYGVLTRDEIDCCRQLAGRKPLTKDDVPLDKKFVHVITTMIGDTVVRAVLNPLDSGSFPYHVLPWQRRAGYWAGIGVGEQIKAPQRVLNAAARAMLNNAGKSSGSQIVIDQGAIRPANGNWGLEPDKIWYKTSDSPGDDVRKAFYAFDIPNMTDEMLKIIEFAEKQGENATSIPLVTQGQSGETTPDTFGGMQLQDNNANQLLHSIGENTDDNVTEPLITQCYEWLLLDPKVPKEEKGDFKIDARGSAALVERAIQDQTLATLVPVAKDPAFGLSPRRAMEEYLKSRRMDPKKLQYTEEEQQKIDSQPPPVDPRVQAAQILAASRTQIAQGAQGADAQLSQQDIQLRREEMQQEIALKQLEYANKNGMTLTQVKAELAKTAMTLQAQRELAAADHGVDLHKHHNPGASGGEEEGSRTQPRHTAPPISGPAKPIAQLPGRAADGEAFTQAEDDTVTS